MSSLADRIKIARKAASNEIDLAIQFILNCGMQVCGSWLRGLGVGGCCSCGGWGALPARRLRGAAMAGLRLGPLSL